jgi:elongation factor Ts
MTAISANLVKELRDKTGAGMMECKSALAEAGGDVARAEDILRIKGGAKASKAASRVAAEGVIGAWVAPDGRTGALVELNCETDFVAKNEDFMAFAAELAALVGQGNPADVPALLGQASNGASGEQKRQRLIQKIGENISVRRFERLAASGRVALYIHSNRKTGVLVDFEGPDDAGKDIAMHVAFHKPAFLSRTEVAADVVARERQVLEARAAESGKPAEIVARMVEGGLNKFLGEITLLGQPFVKDDKQTVEKVLKSRNAKVSGYRFLVVGAGIEKKTAD